MRRLLTVENPILRQKSELVLTIDSLVRDIVSDLEKAMGQKYRGLEPAGFAAPQLGELLRIIIVKRDSESNLVILNPEIVYEKGEQKELEGCFSIPGRSFIVPRPLIVKCRGLNINGESQILKARGLGAAILKHEIDHLDGILIDVFGEEILFYKEGQVDGN